MDLSIYGLWKRAFKTDIKSTVLNTRAHVFTHNHSNLISHIGHGRLLIKIVCDVNLMLIVFIIIVRPES